MSDGTMIEWTDATWNPVTGCSVISLGCTNCYAMKLAGTRMKNHHSRTGLTTDSKAGPVWNGQVRFNEDWLTQPLAWTRPRMIFVCAHGDLFHESVPDEWIARVFAVMALAPRHRFQVLTKRSKRMRAWVTDRMSDGMCGAVEHRAKQIYRTQHGHDMPVGKTLAGTWPWPHVWLGVSAEDQTRADERIPELLHTPAAVRFVSLEPLLEAIELRDIDDGVDSLRRRSGPCLDWVITGGESGPNARPMHPDWARSIRDQCQAASVPFFFKQWGSWLPWEQDQVPLWRSQNGRCRDSHTLFPADWDDAPDWDDGLWAIPDEKEHAVFQRVGKKRAGRLLDGVEHNGMPA